jgi:hypothetical protein
VGVQSLLTRSFARCSSYSPFCFCAAAAAARRRRRRRRDGAEQRPDPPRRGLSLESGELASWRAGELASWRPDQPAFPVASSLAASRLCGLLRVGDNCAAARLTARRCRASARSDARISRPRASPRRLSAGPPAGERAEQEGRELRCAAAHGSASCSSSPALLLRGRLLCLHSRTRLSATPARGSARSSNVRRYAAVSVASRRKVALRTASHSRACPSAAPLWWSRV